MRSSRGRHFGRLDDSTRDLAVLPESAPPDSVPVDTNVELLGDETEGTHVLMRSRFMLAMFSLVQTVFALSAVGVLGDASVRTGWAHTFGLFCAVLCAVEGRSRRAPFARKAEREGGDFLFGVLRALFRRLGRSRDEHGGRRARRSRRRGRDGRVSFRARVGTHDVPSVRRFRGTGGDERVYF